MSRARLRPSGNIESFWKSKFMMTYDRLGRRWHHMERTRPPSGSSVVVNTRTDTVVAGRDGYLGWILGASLGDPLRIQECFPWPAAPPCPAGLVLVWNYTHHIQQRRMATCPGILLSKSIVCDTVAKTIVWHHPSWFTRYISPWANLEGVG